MGELIINEEEHIDCWVVYKYKEKIPQKREYITRSTGDGFVTEEKITPSHFQYVYTLVTQKEEVDMNLDEILKNKIETKFIHIDYSKFNIGDYVPIVIHYWGSYKGVHYDKYIDWDKLHKIKESK